MKIGYAGSPETFLDDVLLSLNRIVELRTSDGDIFCKWLKYEHHLEYATS